MQEELSPAVLVLEPCSMAKDTNSSSPYKGAKWPLYGPLQGCQSRGGNGHGGGFYSSHTTVCSRNILQVFDGDLASWMARHLAVYIPSQQVWSEPWTSCAYKQHVYTRCYWRGVAGVMFQWPGWHSSHMMCLTFVHVIGVQNINDRKRCLQYSVTLSMLNSSMSRGNLFLFRRWIHVPRGKNILPLRCS